MMIPQHLVLAASLLLASVTACLGAAPADSARYFRHLVFNHSSPHLDYTGVCEITATEAAGAEHYEFVYNEAHRLTTILNYSSEAWHNHPFTHLGAFRTAFAYEGDRETREFFDRAGQRVANLRAVYKEVYTHAPDGTKRSLHFYDLADRPMESNWGISRYTWEPHGDLIVERRYNLRNELVPLAPSFPFHISGLQYDQNGHFCAHYNLDDNLQVVNSPFGVACFNDVFAANGNHLGLTYLDQDGRIAPSPWQFAIVRLTYDAAGNVVCEEMLDPGGRLLRRTEFAYDETGRLIQK